MICGQIRSVWVVEGGSLTLFSWTRSDIDTIGWLIIELVGAVLAPMIRGRTDGMI